MTKTYKIFFILFIIVILVLLFFLGKYNDILKQEQTDILVSKNIELISNEILYEKKHALSLAILFSKNHNIINFLKQNRFEELKEELNAILNTIASYTNLENIQIQVHTKDLKVFVRSWEDKDKGLSLEDFRYGLVKVKQTQQPYVSNELGKRLNIKAISPIFDGGEYIGSIEVISDYKFLKKRLKLNGIDIIPLLDKSYLDIAEYYKNNDFLHDYIVIEEIYNKRFFNILYENKQIFSFDNHYYNIDGEVVVLLPIGSIKGKTPGYIAALFKNSKQDFNYLPKYEYDGFISETNYNSDGVHIDKSKIIIK